MLPDGTVDQKTEVCRTKTRQGEQTAYLFNHKALAKVFRAKILNGINEAGIMLPDPLPILRVIKSIQPDPNTATAKNNTI